MSNDKPTFELPRQIEKGLASLAFYYGQNGKTLLQKLLVNSHYRIIEGWTCNGWGDGTWGHSITFKVPMVIYHEIFDYLNDVTKELETGINRMINVRGEYIADVSLEFLDDPALENWRDNSGLLLRTSVHAPQITDDQLQRLWKPGFLRIFLSHKCESKEEAFEIKESFQGYGVSCFVAHADIQPNKEWQDEIERALFSMDALVALLTPSFFDSFWTNQEIGVGIGRGVPIISIRSGEDPKGFIGKYQATSNQGTDKTLEAVHSILWDYHFLEPTLVNALLCALENAMRYPHAITASKTLAKRLHSASPTVIERIEKALADNHYVKDAYHVPERLKRLIEKHREP